ncbi:YidH family protein [Paenibacillus sp. URB8-2]|uniref:YidH family protein n=1 Tax=Paenibacillus sp. URB8-2 TaxID=2741301 RepID=UPI0015BD93D8|nr:DUF202 domain-containing protein [Paenibacillus sp. URB8-2]BCG60408.1 hypothetical protein PUR_38330 [Paenibacillus sp. URB8-2]
MNLEKTVDSKYIQQHLANERTFLAWVRTAIAIVGLGFLSAGIVFRSTPYEHIGHTIAAVVGISAVFLGIMILGMATKDYFRKRIGINKEMFRAPTTEIRVVFVGLGFIGIFLTVLVIVLLLY